MLTGREIKNTFREGANAGLLDAANLILAKAKADVPIGDPSEDPNEAVALRDSGHIEIERGGRTVEIVFDTPYAAKIHEAQHFKHPRGGRAKYLEANLLEMVPQLEGIVASEVRKRFSGRR